MDQNDYFAPVKFSREPLPKKPHTTLVMYIVAGAVIVGVFGGLAWSVFAAISAAKIQFAGTYLEAETIPAAGVRIGEPLAWHELATFDWEVSGDRPRPNIVLGEFNDAPGGDILMINLAGMTDIIEPDGTRTSVEHPKWQAVSTFASWDYDSDGVAELVPTAALYYYQPKAKSYVTMISSSRG